MIRLISPPQGLQAAIQLNLLTSSQLLIHQPLPNHRRLRVSRRPELPDTPMHIPSREATQPGMPNSYTAARSIVANSPFASLANVEPRRSTVPPRSSQPSPQATARRQPTVNSNQTATQPAQTAQPGQTQAIPAVNQVSVQPSTANATQYSRPVQAVAPQPAQQFVAQPPYNQAYAGPQVVAMPSTQPTLQTSTSQWGQPQQQTTPAPTTNAGSIYPTANHCTSRPDAIHANGPTRSAQRSSRCRW